MTPQIYVTAYLLHCLCTFSAFSYNVALYMLSDSIYTRHCGVDMIPSTIYTGILVTKMMLVLSHYVCYIQC